MVQHSAWSSIEVTIHVIGKKYKINKKALAFTKLFYQATNIVDMKILKQPNQYRKIIILGKNIKMRKNYF